MSPLKHLPLALVLLAGLALAGLAVPASAGPEEGGADDVSDQIQKQMDKIIRLMEENEDALLVLSTGRKARPQPVEVEPPVQTQNEGDSSGSDPRASPGHGETVEKELGELIRGQRKTAGEIPGQLEELVRMVPL